MIEQQYKKLSDYAKEHNVTYRTAWNRYKSGKIKNAIMDETGHVLIPLFNSNLNNVKSNVILYGRVSNNDRRKELDYQMDRLRQFSSSNGYIIIDEIKEVASGMNDNREKLNKIFKRKDWDILIVENKDRLTRFGFNYIELLLAMMGKRLLVINEVNEDKEDIIQDLVSVIYSFSARIYGLRRKKNKEQILNFLNSDIS